MTRALETKIVEISELPRRPDDVPFKLGKAVFYMAKKDMETPNFLTGAVIEELNTAHKKIAGLEKKITILKIKAARYEGFVAGQKSVKNEGR